MPKLTSLDVLLLSFVTHGLATSYDLMTQAGMPVGLTSQALKRLKRSGLLTGVIGARRSERFSITEKGEEEFRAALISERGEGRSSWLGRYGVFDSAPKAWFLEWFCYSEQDSGWNHMKWSIGELKHRIREKNLEVDRCLHEIYRLRSAAPEGDSPDIGPVAARVYWWMKVVSDVALLKAQVEVLENLASVLSKMPPIAQPRAMFLETLQTLADEDLRLDLTGRGSMPGS